MPSTYSTSLGLELIGNGEQAGTWGTTTNNNLGTLVEAAIAGVQPITLTGTTYTLTDYNGLPDESRNAVLVFGGLLGAPCNVIAPAVEKTYIVRNFSNATVTIKTASGNGVSIANAASEVIFCNGTDFFSATQFNYIDGDLTVTGNTALQNNVTMATNSGATVTIGGDVYGNSNTGQWYIPTGNTVSRAATGTNGLLRYNTDLQIYEGYQNNVWVKFITANELNYTVNYMVVAGGGGGGGGRISGSSQSGGGGGAGGLYSGSATFTSGAVFTMTIGAGGPSYTNGYNSSISGVYTAIGGGTGGTGNPDGGLPGTAGASGGSGGGGSRLAAGGGATSGQGNAGAADQGGGGGSGTVGNGGPGGSGGAGSASSISGSTVTYAGGGGAGDQYSPGAGGSGGGGAGGASAASGYNGTASLGGGGGGGGPFDTNGGSGGSGVIFLSIPTASYTGTTTGTPTVTVAGSNTILKYTISGTYTA